MTEVGFFPQRPDAHPMIYAYEEPNNPALKSMLKVGYTSVDVEQRVAQQYPTKRPGGQPYRIVFQESAMRTDGTSFMDHDVHKQLRKYGFHNPEGEWFECSVKDVRAAWMAVRDYADNEELRDWDFKMRPEQEDAVIKTEAYYRDYEQNAGGRTPKFLWNAKMRFGKTFASYQLAKRMGFKRVLILTFKPAVMSAWEEDLIRHKDFEGWQFIARPKVAGDPNINDQFQRADKNKPIVCFGSFQDFLGRDSSTGRIKAHHQWVRDEDWDLVIFDEYHFGAWNDNSKKLFEQEEEDELNTTEEAEAKVGKVNTGNEVNEGDLPISTRYYLFLSGTPFRALNSGEFIEEQIYNWTYSDEQSAKERWIGKDNPYASLPRMVMLTYKIPDEIRNIALGGEYNSFDLNAFFEAKGEGDSAEFVLKDYVQKWLDLIRGAYSPNAVDDLKLGAEKPALPYSDARLLSVLTHTLWYLPRVNSCYAMRNLLRERQNVFFHDYDIFVCAGPEAGIGENALINMRKKMEKPLSSKTITLTCGKLTTGVTVKPWTGIFMLTNMRSPETYFQAAFRVQSPWTVKDDSGNEEIIKKECYVFDFALDRALRMVSDYSCRLSVDETGPEQKVGEFINFLPVLAYDGSTMQQVSAADILDMAMAGTSATLLARRWESALLVNVDNDTLRRLMANEDAMRALMSIEGFRALGSDIIETIVNKSEAVKKAKRENPDPTPKEKKELTAEEKEFKTKRKQVQEKLIKFATRIPIFMYLTDYREETLKDVITQLEPGLFKKVTGLTVKDFELLVSLGVFNDGLMNDAVYKFRRYEDSSLSYTGINKHAGEKIGLFDTALTEYEFLYMAQQESMITPDGLAAVGSASKDDKASEKAGGRPVNKTAVSDSRKKVTSQFRTTSVETKGDGSKIVDADLLPRAIETPAVDEDWICKALEDAGIAYVDKRPSQGSIWVVGAGELDAKMKELNAQGADFKFSERGGKVTKHQPSWYMSGYPEQYEVEEEEQPAFTQEQLDALEVGDVVFHKAFGYGTIRSIDGTSLKVHFNEDSPKKDRGFQFPGAFLNGYLQL